MPLKKFLKNIEQIEEQFKKKTEKSHNSDAHDESNWLVSYADMMTLLCVFFVLMFSMAKLDEGKYETLQAEIAKQYGNDYKSPTKETALFISQVLQQEGVEKEIMIKSDPQGVMVTFESTMFFDSMSADIRPEAKRLLNRIGQAVNTRQEMQFKKYKVVVEGHTDSIPVTSGPYPSNWELSAARAAAVIRIFVEGGFLPDHMTAIGYADTRPEVIERTPAGERDSKLAAKNRRVVLRILEPRVDSIPFPETAKPLTPAAVPAVSAH